ncbi:MAG: exodeoxyribonuclease VII small subunit [Clostridiales bacterium]|nr:exodeoxyribonuclease VII small subunit [Clostridiales bacterium]
MATSEFSIEKAFEELDQILVQMEDENLGLADSLDLYKKGVKLLEQCGQTLDQTEKEIIVLQEGQDGDIPAGEDSE